MALRLALRTTHRLAAQRLAANPAAAAAMASRRAFSDRGIFEDQEEAREVQFIRKKDKDNLQGLFDKMQAAEQNQTEAKEALAKILGPGIPDEVVKDLFAWKDRFASTRLGVTGLER